MLLLPLFLLLTNYIIIIITIIIIIIIIIIVQKLKYLYTKPQFWQNMVTHTYHPT